MSKKSAPISTSLSAESADCAQNDFDSVKNSLNDVLKAHLKLPLRVLFKFSLNTCRFYQLIAVLCLALLIR